MEVGRAMETFHPQPSAALTLQCPHCGHADDDVFELIDANRFDAMRCSSCGQVFHFVVIACDGCGTERVLRWTQRPELWYLQKLACQRCGIDLIDAVFDTETPERPLFVEEEPHHEAVHSPQILCRPNEQTATRISATQ
jgi:uncharacterized Zn finger protein